MRFYPLLEELLAIKGEEVIFLQGVSSDLKVERDLNGKKKGTRGSGKSVREGNWE